MAGAAIGECRVTGTLNALPSSVPRADPLSSSLSSSPTADLLGQAAPRTRHGPVLGSTLFAILSLRLVILPLVVALVFIPDEIAGSREGSEPDNVDEATTTTRTLVSEKASQHDQQVLSPNQVEPPTKALPGAFPSPARSRHASFRHERSEKHEVSREEQSNATLLPRIDIFDAESPPTWSEEPQLLAPDKRQSLQRQESVRSALGIETVPSGYTYAPFQSGNAFRLLTLSPKLDALGRMVCLLVDHEMKDQNRPRYRALSYHWGDTRDRQQIIINGKPAYVTLNLYAALKTLRRSNDESPLWIDALCINQADPNERNHQVSQMRDIFGNAEEVIAWIGSMEHESPIVMSVMKMGWERAILMCSALDRTSEEYGRYSTTLRDANCKFFMRPYWSRAWIIQELVVAKDVVLMCGNNTARWSEFESYVMHFRSSGSKVMGRYPEELRKVINERMKLLMLRDGYRESRSTLLTLISASARALATDPRDKIFALLGLVSPGGIRPIKPDYTLSPCAVYCKALRHMYREEHHVNEGSIQYDRRLEVIKLMDYFRRECIHNPFDSGQSVPSHDCDGIGCGSQRLCFEMPALLGKNGIHVPTRFYEVQLLARSPPLK